MKLAKKEESTLNHTKTCPNRLVLILLPLICSLDKCPVKILLDFSQIRNSQKEDTQ